MKTNRQSLFQFLYHKEITPCNNDSECGVRNFKVKQKVSGRLKTGYNDYAVLRSVINTSIKRKSSGNEINDTFSSNACSAGLIVTINYLH